MRQLANVRSFHPLKIVMAQEGAEFPESLSGVNQIGAIPGT